MGTHGQNIESASIYEYLRAKDVQEIDAQFDDAGAVDRDDDINEDEFGEAKGLHSQRQTISPRVAHMAYCSITMHDQRESCSTLMLTTMYALTVTFSCK